MTTRPKFGPDGSITNLDELPRPQREPYESCRRPGCGHGNDVHDYAGCHGQKLLSLYDGAEWAGSDSCECEGFVRKPPATTITIPEAEYDALNRLYEEARGMVGVNPCVAHDLLPCNTCLVGTDWDDLRERVEDVGLLR